MNYKQCYHKESRKPNEMADEMGAEVGALILNTPCLVMFYELCPIFDSIFKYLRGATSVGILQATRGLPSAPMTISGA